MDLVVMLGRRMSAKTGHAKNVGQSNPNLRYSKTYESETMSLLEAWDNPYFLKFGSHETNFQWSLAILTCP
jgi:hypothetical protein